MTVKRDASLPVNTSLPSAGDSTAEGRTRDRVVELLVELGPQTAAELSERLGLVPAAIRRHLDTLLEQGHVRPAQRRPGTRRGRGRPAQAFELTEAAKSQLPHLYDDLATVALRHLAEYAGSAAVERLAAERVAELERRCRDQVDAAGEDPAARTEALAAALTTEGYAATASMIASGGMLCQHHCPVAHVATEFPQLCEAETAVISRLVGSHVQRLATIAHGDGVCTTHIPITQISVKHVPAGNVSAGNDSAEKYGQEYTRKFTEESIRPGRTTA